MKTILIGDPGSTHCGDFEMAKELVRVGAQCGLDAVKFQLFPDIKKYRDAGNIPLKYSRFAELVMYGEKCGVEVFASVFDEHSYGVAVRVCDSVKFSYKSPMSIWINQATTDFKKVYVSGDIMNPPPIMTNRLYCIPEYPVTYTVAFDCIFTKCGFDGFSDHTMGISQSIRAVDAGARIIEKHYRLEDIRCDTVPDGKFAITPKMLERLAKHIHG